MASPTTSTTTDEVVSASRAHTAFNPNFLNNLLAVHALLWENGKAIDLGNLGSQTGQAGGNAAYRRQ